MALLEEIEASGNWLFRRRSYLPVLLLVPIIVSMRGYSYPNGSHAMDMAWELLCLAVALVGVGIRAATVGFTPRGTSGRNTNGQVAESLNTTGMYSIVRHPLYLGNYFMWLGPALFPRSLSTAVLVSLIFWLYYERIMVAEEEFLRRKFGTAYEEWAAGTPAFLPRLRGWKSPALSFSLRNVLRREYSGVFAVIAILAGLELAGDVFATGRVVHDPLWVAILLGGALMYVTLRSLKRSTSVLNVDGR